MGDDVDMENNVNFQNVSQANDTQCSKRSRGPSDSADHDRKNTRKSYRMLMETTAKFDDLDPREVLVGLSCPHFIFHCNLLKPQN